MMSENNGFVEKCNFMNMKPETRPLKNLHICEKG